MIVWPVTLQAWIAFPSCFSECLFFAKFNNFFRAFLKGLYPLLSLAQLDFRSVNFLAGNHLILTWNSIGIPSGIGLDVDSESSPGPNEDVNEVLPAAAAAAATTLSCGSSWMAIIWIKWRTVFLRSHDEPRRRSNRHSVGPQYITANKRNNQISICAFVCLHRKKNLKNDRETAL